MPTTPPPSTRPRVSDGLDRPAPPTPSSVDSQPRRPPPTPATPRPRPAPAPPTHATPRRPTTHPRVFAVDRPTQRTEGATPRYPTTRVDGQRVRIAAPHRDPLSRHTPHTVTYIPTHNGFTPPRLQAPSSIIPVANTLSCTLARVFHASQLPSCHAPLTCGRRVPSQSVLMLWRLRREPRTRRTRLANKIRTHVHLRASRRHSSHSHPRSQGRRPSG
jgi:hypothetical protein